VRGRSLADIIRRQGKMPEGRALEIARQMALAVQHACENGLIHRDIKPSNILITEETGEAKVSDFGVVKCLDTSDGERTQAGQVLGSPYYMAPEQAASAEDIDVRADLYGIGASMFHMVTGKKPFQSGAVTEVLLRRLREEFPDPKDSSRNVSDRMRELILRATHKDPRNRQQTPEELIEDIDLVSAGQMPRHGQPSRFFHEFQGAPASAGPEPHIDANTGTRPQDRTTSALAENAHQPAPVSAAPPADEPVDPTVEIAQQIVATRPVRPLRLTFLLLFSMLLMGGAAVGGYYTWLHWDQIDPHVKHWVSRLEELPDQITAEAPDAPSPPPASDAPQTVVGSNDGDDPSTADLVPDVNSQNASTNVPAEINLDPIPVETPQTDPDPLAGIPDAPSTVEEPDLQQRLDKARALLAQDKVGIALAFLHGVVNDFPDAADALALRAKARMATGREDERKKALDDLNEAISLAPRDHGILLVRARLHHDRKDWLKAEGDYGGVLALGGENTQARLGRAEARAATQQYPAALEDLQALLSRVPDHIEGRLLRAEILLKTDELDRSVADCDAVLKHVKDHPEALRLRGLACLAQDRYGQAKADLERAGAAQGDTDLRLALARATVGFADEVTDSRRAPAMEQAQKLLRDVLAERPNDPDARLATAWLLSLQARYVEALEQVNMVLKSGGENFETYLMRGRIHEQQNVLPKAIEDYDRAVQLAPRTPSTRLARARCRMKLGEYRKAEEDVTECIEAGWRKDDLYFVRGLAREAQGDLDGAYKDFDWVAENEPGRARGPVARARVERLTGKAEQALKTLTYAERRAKDSPQPSIAKGELLLELGRAEAALAALSRAVKLAPEQPDVLVVRGRAHAHLGQWEKSDQDFRSAVAINSRDGNTWLEWGLSEAARGRKTEALQKLHRAARYLKDDDPRLLRARGKLLLEQGLADDALRDLRKLVQLRSTESRSWQLRGQALLAKHLPKQALSDFRQALELNPGNIAALVGRAQAYLAMDDPAAAVEDLKRALALQHNSPKLHQTIADAYEAIGDRESRRLAQVHRQEAAQLQD
jgi:tetratricopeptide (TPR) repeat protein